MLMANKEVKHLKCVPKRNCDILNEHSNELISNEVFQLLNKCFSKQYLNVKIWNTIRDISIEQKLCCFTQNCNKFKLYCYSDTTNRYSGNNIHSNFLKRQVRLQYLFL